MNVGTLSYKKVPHQYQLEKLLHEVFPGVHILSNVRKDGIVCNPQTNAHLEIDTWIPDLQLGLEFQDAHHYVSTWYYNEPLSSIERYDNLKDEQAKNSGTTLIQIPCWWDGESESLLASIYFQRPDLILGPDHINPIPMNPLPSFFAPARIPDVGELMLALFVPLQASSILTLQASSEHLLEGFPWWLGEKYDGVRCIWHPIEQNLYTRHRFVIPLLPCVKKQLSSVDYIDGEIWSGRGCYQQASRVVRSSADTDSQKIVAFDAPSPSLQSMPFEQRYSSLLDNITPQNPSVVVAARKQCTKPQTLAVVLQHILEDQGEGVILRKPESVYEHGRSHDLLKIKAARSDMEALVIESNEDGCLIQLINGTKLHLEHHQVITDQNPIEGNVVTLEYDHFSKSNVPVEPKLTKIRYDLDWKDVVRDFVYEKLSKDDAPLRDFRKPLRHWSAEEEKRARFYLGEYARQLNKDPLLPETWYSTSLKDIQLHMGEQPTFLRRGYVKTVMELFPEIGLEETKFSITPVRYYADIDNRRSFFDTFAKEQGFDPLRAENWQRVQATHIKNRKGSDSVLSHYQGSVTKALSHLYPQLKLLETRNYTRRKRMFFEQFAKDNGFDPLIAENWYNANREELKARKGFTDIIKEFRGNITTALLDVFPNIHLKASKFAIHGKNHWRKERNRKAFFDQYAKDNGFDPLIAENWYGVTGESILARKFSSMVVRYYRGNVVQALVSLYPNIGLKTDSFPARGRAYWSVQANRRKYFDAFAQHHGFDPLIPNNWYSISIANLNAFRRADFLYQYHNDLRDALTSLYPNIGLNFATKRKASALVT